MAIGKCFLQVLLSVFLCPGLFSTFGYAQGFVVCPINGQLGNQMFEIAATLSLAWDHDARALFPDLRKRVDEGIPTNYREVFGDIDTSQPNEPICFYYQEPYLHYEPIPFRQNMQICGYFQSEKYFRNYKDKIIALFSPKPKILDYLASKYGSIIDNPHTVSIHIRTYVRDGKKEHPNGPVFALNGYEYVSSAVKLFPDDSLFVVFSDDIPWCKKELASLPHNLLFIEGEHYLHDFYLMNLCKHNIISNSSFSWWAAYLNPNPNKVVVAPSKWFVPSVQPPSEDRDRIPSEWIVID